jgi:hypothetical protein
MSADDATIAIAAAIAIIRTVLQIISYPWLKFADAGTNARRVPWPLELRWKRKSLKRKANDGDGGITIGANPISCDGGQTRD